jgi:hypothetical protein
MSGSEGEGGNLEATVEASKLHEVGQRPNLPDVLR